MADQQRDLVALTNISCEWLLAWVDAGYLTTRAYIELMTELAKIDPLPAKRAHLRVVRED